MEQRKTHGRRSIATENFGAVTQAPESGNGLTPNEVRGFFVALVVPLLGLGVTIPQMRFALKSLAEKDDFWSVYMTMTSNLEALTGASLTTRDTSSGGL